ncbi:hypothetical protein C0991_005792 [Blastosporella zonata]|nr:hypothetical protein C0991_005792 [Blastosporella zonata]
MPTQHTQEVTALSLTDTFVDRGENLRPGLPSTFSGTTIVASPSGINGFNDARPVTVTEKVATIEPVVKLPPVIPPEHEKRTLVVCFDGTGDQFDADNSNIVQLVSLLKKNDRNKQMVYYQAGIGTYISPKVATPMTAKMSKILDEMFAWNLDAHVMSGYEFLMQNYLEGDKICIFGFSRGAYTARSLAGMLHKVGLLPADNHQQVPFAYKMYTRADDLGWEQSNAFKLAFSSPVTIEFLGVWDTVDSVGIIPKRLPFTTSNTIVRTFRHAISLDERRAKFKPNFWNRPTDGEQALGVHTVRIPTPEPKYRKNGKAVDAKGEHVHEHSVKSESKEDKKLSQFENIYSDKDTHHKTDIEEVWFAVCCLPLHISRYPTLIVPFFQGCHCGSFLLYFFPTCIVLMALSLDVGGGSVDNKTPNSLARIPLRWMVRECFKSDTGVMFNTEALRTIGLDPSTLYPYVLPRPPPRLSASSYTFQKATKPSFFKRVAAHRNRKANAAASVTVTVNDQSKIDEELEDMKDAMSPVYDQLQLKSWWWILEIIPLNLRYQNGNNEWVTNFRPNLANPRFIPKQHSNGVKVHRSVKLRMDAQSPPGHKCKYSPRAHFSVEPTWID